MLSLTRKGVRNLSLPEHFQQDAPPRDRSGWSRSGLANSRPRFPQSSLVDRIPPIYAVAIAIVSRRRARQLSHRDSAWLRVDARCVWRSARFSLRDGRSVWSRRTLRFSSRRTLRSRRCSSRPTMAHSVATLVGWVARHDRRTRVSRDRTRSLRRSAVRRVERAAEQGGSMSRVERQCPNRGAWWRRVQAGRRNPAERADSFSAQLRQSRRVRLRRTDGARRHRRDNDGAEEVARLGDVSDSSAIVRSFLRARLNR